MPNFIAEFFIKFLTDKNDLVLDPFSGSNTTGEISELLKMSGFYRIEFCEKLDFCEKNNTKNPISLYFRAKGELNEIV